MKQKLAKKIQVTAKLEVITGLHIGDSKENVEIGGVDIPVVRVRFHQNRLREPYIPGSSIKGKMRCLLEQMEGAHTVGANEEINELFGITANENKGLKQNIPSKLIVRDAYLNSESAEALRSSEYTDLPFTEVKWENTILRVEGRADHPRQIERIPAGAKFDLNFILNIWGKSDSQPDEVKKEEEKLKKLFEKGVKALNHDYLGGNGSRGYGQVNITDIEYQEILI
jgi:CRISPR-associated protein Csm3